MTILTFPDGLVPDSMDINLVSNSKSFESVFNNTTITTTFPGQRWEISLEFNKLDQLDTTSELFKLQSFLWSLDGMNGRFYCPIFGNRGGVAKGTPLVNGATQTGTILVTDGWTPNTVVLRQGQAIQIGTELKIVTADCVSSSGGAASIQFVPALRTSPADDDPIITDNPVGVFRLADNDQGQFTVAEGLLSTVSFDIVEVF